MKQQPNPEPLIPASTNLPEFTVKSIIISICLAIILAAANSYLALKIGTTIAASIPASVLALGILRFFRQSNVLECNIIQTAASAGEGMAAAVSFILPAMLVLHVWTGFPYWESTIISVLGGLLGVLFSIPLRRVLLNLPMLRFPEGTATGNVLRYAVKGGQQLKFLIYGSSVGGLVVFLQAGLQVLASNLMLWTQAGQSLIGITFGFNPATLAAGYIIGFEAGLGLLVGLVVGWLVILPIIAVHYGVPADHSVYSTAMSIWSQHLRYVGVGSMLVGGVWTLLRLLKPIINGLRLSFVSLRRQSLANQKQLPRTERDLSIFWVLMGVIVLIVMIFIYLTYAIHEFNIISHVGHIILLALFTVLFIAVIGFLLAAICGYFTGLIGSTNSPLSGMLIIAILILSSLYLLFFGGHVVQMGARIASVVILVATVIAAIASVSLENIQDLKAGQIVGSTPWKQQVMLAIGVVVSSLVIAPILSLLFHAYGMAGVFPHPGMDETKMLAAPQAGLMAAITRGILTHHLEWGMIGVGVVLAVVVIIINYIMERHNRFLSPLAVGLAIYLPPMIMTPTIIGAIISTLVKRRNRKLATTPELQQAGHEKFQQGILLASGMVAGSALMGVILAIPFVLLGSSNALAIVGGGFLPIATILGIVVFVLLCFWFYRTGKL